MLIGIRVPSRDVAKARTTSTSLKSAGDRKNSAVRRTSPVAASYRYHAGGSVKLVARYKSPSPPSGASSSTAETGLSGTRPRRRDRRSTTRIPEGPPATSVTNSRVPVARIPSIAAVSCSTTTSAAASVG